MPTVQIDLMEGRSLEQKRELAEKITAAVASAAKCPPEAVTILIRDISPANISLGGQLRCDRT